MAAIMTVVCKIGSSHVPAGRFPEQPGGSSAGSSWDVLMLPMKLLMLPLKLHSSFALHHYFYYSTNTSTVLQALNLLVLFQRK